VHIGKSPGVSSPGLKFGLTERSQGASSARWPKAGTIERVIRDVPDADGRQLHAHEKLIAAYLLTYGRTADADPRAMVDIERPKAGTAKADDDERVPSMEEALGLSGKTLYKYLGALERRKLIEMKRDRPNGAVTFYLGQLVKRYAEDRFRKDSRTVIELPSTAVLKQRDAGSEAFSAGSETFSEQTLPVLESFQDPIELVRGELVRTSTEHTALARRLGLKITKNADGSDHVAFFANHPRRFAAAYQVEFHLLSWGITGRRIGKIFRDYRFASIAGAVGYVLQQLERDRETSLLSGDDRKRLNLQEVTSKPALFESALSQGWVGTLPGFEDDVESPHGGGASFEDDLWAYLREMVRRRRADPAVKVATFDVCLKNAKLRVAGDVYMIVVRDAFALALSCETTATVLRCLEQIGYPNAVVTFTSETACTPGSGNG